MSKVYIHELIDVIGHNRGRYMHHMTANWCPVARAERNQLCLGVWATLGSTRTSSRRSPPGGRPMI